MERKSLCPSRERGVKIPFSFITIQGEWKGGQFRGGYNAPLEKMGDLFRTSEEESEATLKRIRLTARRGTKEE